MLAKYGEQEGKCQICIDDKDEEPVDETLSHVLLGCRAATKEDLTKSQRF